MSSNPGCSGPCGDVTDFVVTWRHFEVRGPPIMTHRIRFEQTLRGHTNLNMREFLRLLGLVIERHFQFNTDDEEILHPQCLGFIVGTQLPRGWTLELDRVEDDGTGPINYHLSVVPAYRNLYLEN